jgi:hypothetical protein
MGDAEVSRLEQAPRGGVCDLLGLMNARWVSVHEVDVRLSFSKLVPLGRLQEIL